MKQLCWIIIALFMGKLTNVQMFLTEQSLLSPDQATRDEGWKGCVLASDGDFKILCVAFNPTKLNEIQNQIQCFAGNNIKNYSSTLASIEMLFLRILELKWFCLLQFLPHIRLKRVSGYSLPGRRKYCFKIFFHENMP